MSSTNDSQAPDPEAQPEAKPDDKPDDQPDNQPDNQPDVESDTGHDPARATQDEGWTSEGGATPVGPATATDDES